MCPHHPFPKSHGNPKSMNKLTLNEPAIIIRDRSWQVPFGKISSTLLEQRTVCAEFNCQVICNQMIFICGRSWQVSFGKFVTAASQVPCVVNQATLLPPGSRPLGKNMGPDRKRHHTPLERTWDQTESDIIHPPWYWHLVAATAAIGRHPTGMDSCLILCLNFSLVSKDFYLKN